MAARGKLPEGFDDLPYKKRRQVIDEAPLGKIDRRIASMYFLDEYPQVDVAAAVHLDRSSVSRRLPRIRCILERCCKRT